MAEDSHGRGQMYQVRSLLQELQGFCHRFQELLHRLFTLCGVWGLLVTMQEGCYSLLASIEEDDQGKRVNRASKS